MVVILMTIISFDYVLVARVCQLHTLTFIVVVITLFYPESVIPIQANLYNVRFP